MIRRNHESGLYVVFEGLPKSGKSTQVGLLRQAVSGLNLSVPVVYTKEPGGSEVADAIRKVAQGMTFSEEMTTRAEAYLYAASRAHTLETIVKPALEWGEVVIADRSVYSSLAIQGRYRGLTTRVVMDINNDAINGLWPDHVFFIDTSPEVCYERAKNDPDVGDKFERMGLDFFQIVREGYGEFTYQSQFERISGDRSIESIHGIILQSMITLLKEKKML